MLNKFRLIDPSYIHILTEYLVRLYMVPCYLSDSTMQHLKAPSQDPQMLRPPWSAAGITSDCSLSSQYKQDPTKAGQLSECMYVCLSYVFHFY